MKMLITMRCLRRTSLLLAILFSAAFTMSAQEVTAKISGTVTDPSGAAVQGATVTLTNGDRGIVERTLHTNAAGFYTATDLTLGTYQVKIESPGFKTETVTGLPLHVGDALTANGKLEVGSTSQEVNVQAEAVQLNF